MVRFSIVTMTHCTLYTDTSAWITVTVCSLAADNQHSAVFNVCKMLRPDFLLMRLLGRMRHLIGSTKQLHWLPVLSRIQCKLCTLMFDIQHGITSQYLAEVCDRCDNTRLRSAARGNFALRRTRLRVSDEAFSVAGLQAWNALTAGHQAD